MPERPELYALHTNILQLRNVAARVQFMQSRFFSRQLLGFIRHSVSRWLTALQTGKGELFVDLREQPVEPGLIVRLGTGDQNILRV